MGGRSSFIFYLLEVLDELRLFLDEDAAGLVPESLLAATNYIRLFTELWSRIHVLLCELLAKVATGGEGLVAFCQYREICKC